VIDNISKFLIEEYSADFANWLLGTPTILNTISPSELNVEPTRADSVILMSSPDLILHTEFQTTPVKNMPFRMADYYLRLKRKYPRKQIFQVVIYLKKTDSDLVQETEYKTPEMIHRFRVIRLWEQPVEEFLQTPGLLPYAVLSRAENKAQILAQVLTEIEKLPKNRQQENLTAAVEILAGLELTVATIEQLMRNKGMQESVIYQKILQEGEQRGRMEGEQRGRIEGEQQEKALVLRLLTKKIGNLTPVIQSQVNGLGIALIEALGEDLLDFSSIDDLQQWFARHEAK
jgi:predicted transposase/invertase (TIGR01784 family)